MQNFTDIPSSHTLKNSLPELLNNDKTIVSNNAGTAFPTTNLFVGMECYRTDLEKLYELRSTGPDVWVLTADMTKTITDKDYVDTQDALKQSLSGKDATGGYVGLTLFKINFKNVANTFTSFLTNANTAARTYTFQDRNGTIADDTDLALKANLAAPSFTGNLVADTNTLAVDATNHRVGVKTLTPSVSLDVVGTDAIKVPSGTTAQRPAGATGLIRFNATLGGFEGYGVSAWGSIGGGATGGGSDKVFNENDTTVTTDYTITTGKNAISAGPITINSGVTVTVPSGSVWTIV